MAKKIDSLREGLSPERRARIEAKKEQMRSEMRLYDLRRARELSQETIAATMGVPQSAISKIERRTDAYVSTVRRYLQAMGGELHIVAVFPDGAEIEINQFGTIDSTDLIEA
jgi:transcriptional regulator with XRE-family HTH domain